MATNNGNNANTIREAGATVREKPTDAGATIREDAIDAGATIREDGARAGLASSGAGGGEHKGLEFPIVKRLDARGAEADLLIVRDNGELRALKLYRHGIDPKREILERYEKISGECPEHIVKVYKTGFSKKLGRWYELLEYISGGSVADALEKGVKFNFREFVRELGEAVNALHEHGIAHRDLKPANILVRSEAPLNLVLTDFGISSALDGASVRETDRKGLTPMYAAPEDLLGHIVSRPADWWACGMVFYELLLGSHPFQDLSPNRIAFILSTQGVEIDKNLPEDQQTLLSGLLTRNDKKRWGWRQLQAWLEGRKNIPVYYEVPRDDGLKPFVFEGKPYSDLHALALAFAAGHRQAKSAKGMLARGNVAKWLQSNSQFDEEACLSDEIADNDPDLYLFKFLRHYAPELPFTINGEAVTPENILLWLKNGDGEAEKHILSLFANGKIKKFLPCLPPEKRDPMLEAFAEANWRKDVLLPFSAALAPDKFYWGPKGAPTAPLERIKFAQKHSAILAIESWQEKGGPNFIIPPEVARLFEADKYDEAIALLLEQARNGQLLSTRDSRKKFENNIFTGSQEEYRLAVGRKNGLNDNVISSIKSIQANMAKIQKMPGAGRSEISQECGIITDCLESLLSGKIVWKDSMRQSLRQIESSLDELATDSSSRRFWRILFYFILIPGVALYLGHDLMSSQNINPLNWASSWSNSSFMDGIEYWCALILGAIGLLGGPVGAIIGAIAGYFLGLILSSVFTGIIYVIAFLIAIAAVGMLIYVARGYFRYQGRREQYRDAEAREEAVRNLRQNVLALRREIGG